MDAILVTGSNGNIGSAVIEYLQTKDTILRAGISGARRPTCAGEGSSVVTCNFRDRAQMLQALQGVERAYLMVPFHRDMLEWGRNFVAAGSACGVRFIVRLSALGAGPDSPSAMGRLHGEIDGYVMDSGIDFCIVRCNSFMQNFSGHYSGMIRQGRLCLAQGDARSNFIDTRDIASVVAKVLLAPERFSGRTLDLHGPQCLSNYEAADLISGATGKRLEYVPLTDDQEARHLSRAGIGEWEQAVLRSLNNCLCEGFAIGDPSELEGLLDRDALSFPAFARENRHRWL